MPGQRIKSGHTDDQIGQQVKRAGWGGVGGRQNVTREKMRNANTSCVRRGTGEDDVQT